jgi:hypothetical protein
MFSFGARRVYPIQLRPFSSVSVIGSPCFTYSMLCSGTVEHMNKLAMLLYWTALTFTLTTWHLMPSRFLWASCLMQPHYAH